jgi:hypothetical protein
MVHACIPSTQEAEVDPIVSRKSAGNEWSQPKRELLWASTSNAIEVELPMPLGGQLPPTKCIRPWTQSCRI